jgi:hypothetical protein
MWQLDPAQFLYGVQYSICLLLLLVLLLLLPLTCEPQLCSLALLLLRLTLLLSCFWHYCCCWHSCLKQRGTLLTGAGSHT